MKNTGKDFIEKTKYANISQSDQQKGMKYPPLQETYNKEKKIINLPKIEKLHVPVSSVEKAVKNRRSVRKYEDQALTLDELAWLLWATQGIKKNIKDQATIRTVPSAGARHAFETYLLINNVETLDSGLYRYLALEHSLLQISTTDNLTEKVTEAAMNQGMVRNSAVTFIWVAVPYRMTYRYSERGYRYLFLDAGHVCQNLYLAAEGIDFGVCAIAAYDDDKMNAVLDLDGKKQFAIYLATVGKK
jgi:SagB-type dehydrogenase family enzyme